MAFSGFRQQDTREAMTSQFYVLLPLGGKKLGRTFAFADVEDPQIIGEEDPQNVCPRCGDGLGLLPWLPPHRIALSSQRYPDFLWGVGFDLMVSDRFKQLYRAAGLQGIGHFDPAAEITRVGRRPV